jgi:hypothetical protein
VFTPIYEKLIYEPMALMDGQGGIFFQCNVRQKTIWHIYSLNHKSKPANIGWLNKTKWYVVDQISGKPYV